MVFKPMRPRLFPLPMLVTPLTIDANINGTMTIFRPLRNNSPIQEMYLTDEGR